MRKPAYHLTDDKLHLIAGSCVVTRTKSQQKELQYCFNCALIAQGALSWESPKISNYDQWIERSYEELADMFWDGASRSLISRESLFQITLELVSDVDLKKHVRIVLDAWRLAWDGNLWPVWEDVRHTQNGRMCYDWLAKLQRFLRSESLVSTPELTARLLRALQEKAWKPEPLTFFGFERPTRAQMNLFEELKRVQQSILFHDFSTVETRHGDVVHFESQAHEMTTMTAWAREQLSRFGTQSSIGIVVNDTSTSSATLQRQFESAFPEVDDIHRLVNINTSDTVSENRLIEDALDFLRWTNGDVGYELVQNLGRSPYFRALQIPQRNPSWFTERMSFSYFARYSKNKLVKGLNRQLQRLRKGRRTLAQNIDFFVHLLSRAGWNLDDLDRHELSARKRWDSFLDSLAKTSAFLPRMTWSDAIELIFESKSNIGRLDGSIQAPIQVMTADVCRGMKFDAMWVNGLADTQWPVSPAPNAMIPLALQKEARMPMVTHEQMLDEANLLMKHWFASTETLVLSYADEDEDSINQESFLISQLEKTTPQKVLQHPELASHAHPWANAVQADVVQQYIDDQGSPYPLDDDTQISTAVLRDQMLCPFRAWSIHRLKLTAENKPSFLWDAMERGTVLHEVLRHVIGRKKKQSTLCSMPENAIVRAINDVLNQKRPRPPARFLDNEFNRLYQVVEEWLNFERQRPYFRIKAVEKEAKVQLGEIHLNVRIDRIDETEALQHLIIDYKTGTFETQASWNPAALRNTQIPLYAMTDPTCDGVAYVKFDESKPRWEGIPDLQAPDTDIPIRFKPHEYEYDFELLKENWRECLERILDAYIDGVAEVDPQQGAQTCRTCHLRGLCRIFSQVELDS